MGETKIKVGQLIREARLRAGLTQAELGERLKVSKVTVSGYETGRQNLTLDTLDDIISALEVNLKVTIE